MVSKLLLDCKFFRQCGGGGGIGGGSGGFDGDDTRMTIICKPRDIHLTRQTQKLNKVTLHIPTHYFSGDTFN